MPLKVFRPSEDEDSTSKVTAGEDGEDVIFVGCEPYIILGHAKVDFVNTGAGLKFAVPTIPLDEIYSTLPVSTALREALKKDHPDVALYGKGGRLKVIPIGAGAKVTRGSYVYLTMCSSEKEDFRRTTGEFLDWKAEKELIGDGKDNRNRGLPGGRESVLAYIKRTGLPPSAEVARMIGSLSQRATTIVEATDARRRAQVLPLLNDRRTYLAFSGKGHVLGQAGKGAVASSEQVPMKTRDKAVRRFHEALKEYRAQAQRKHKQSAARDARFQAALKAYRSEAGVKYSQHRTHGDIASNTQGRKTKGKIASKTKGTRKTPARQRGRSVKRR